MTDQLHRFIFDNTSVRGNIAHLSDTFTQALQHHQYPQPIHQILGELMVASAILTATLKLEGGALILQIQGKGIIQLLVVECQLANDGNALTMRATATIDEHIDPTDLAQLNFNQLVGDGHFVITLDPKNGGQTYQGIVPIEGQNIAEILQNYMQRSEQIETRIWIACNQQQATGMLLQKLPETTAAQHDPDAWERLVHLASTTQDEELLTEPSEALLYKLFHQENTRLFEPQSIRFSCGCSRTNVGNMIQLLGQQEAQQVLAEQGQITVNCNFCNQAYIFDSIDIEQLFRNQTPPNNSQIKH